MLKKVNGCPHLLMVTRLRGASPAIWNHTVLPAARRLNPSHAGRYSIYLLQRDGRLSWPWWLVIYRDGLPVHKQSPILVLTTF